MGFELDIFEDKSLQDDYLEWLVDTQSVDIQKHFGRLWDYYANPKVETTGTGAADRKVNESGRCYVQAQEYGLPARITGLMHTGQAGIFGAKPVNQVQRKEVVIENDIAWRVNAAVDFLFGKPITFVSKSPDEPKSAEIQSILKALFAANGEIGFFQDMAVLGSVYGFVDCFVRPDDKIIERVTSPSSQTLSADRRYAGSLDDVLQFAQTIDLELIEAPRALPVLEENDYKKIRYYVQHFGQKKNALSRKNSFLARLLSGGTQTGDNRRVVPVTEITSADAWQRYEDKQLVAEGRMPWGFLPIVHIQNIAQPYYYEGISDVEPLVPLQDELNTRLSDRASRITFQSFKMYLGKGIEGFEDKPVAPGRMWYTDNPEASIEEFGGDTATPSEALHISEIREAMDKVSAVTPLVAGVLKNKLGNLTSAVALRLTLMGMLSKNDRKRFTYSEGLRKICRMVLGILDTANIYKTDEADRDVEIIFPSPLPENTMEKLKEAQIKKELGVPNEQVLRELGYEM
ncbi:MAG TPA: phage portal protein [Sedimentisphaerales bacterium]|nr:phage portal protein [Sedimentisphaerales bacterium]